jgi:hypothetical protein
LLAGNVTLDTKGETVVTMPAWFEALNTEFRYQLTAIGTPSPDLYIAEEITDNRFKIAGGKQGMKVSWLVTGSHQIDLEESRCSVRPSSKGPNRNLPFEQRASLRRGDPAWLSSRSDTR